MDIQTLMKQFGMTPTVVGGIVATPLLWWVLDPLSWTIFSALQLTTLVIAISVGAFFYFRKPGTSKLHVRAKRFANILIGHRGCRHIVSSAGFLIPENSMWAFKHAADQGCDGVELDTRLTKDGMCLNSYLDNVQ
jgi:hypothetical protein